jgi:hypothetical protein
VTKPATVEEYIAVFIRQGALPPTQAEREFIEMMRKFAAKGVGYGWMKQIIDWEQKYRLAESLEVQ